MEFFDCYKNFMEKTSQYQITEELTIDGFSINPAHLLIERNQEKRDFNTLDYFVIHIIMEDAELTVDNSKYNLPKGNLVFLGPGKNIVLGSGYERENGVYVIAFSSSFFEKSANDSLLLHSELFFNNSGVFIVPAIGSTEDIKKLIIGRIDLYETKGNLGLYITVAHNCVEILLLDGLLLINEEKEEKEKLQYRKITYLDVVNKFRILLQKNFKKERSVTFYAEQLHISPRRLTDMCEEVLRKSAKQVIIEKIVSESVRMLKHSRFTISEVGYELGFSDEGNFSTFIKKHIGKIPSDLRDT